MELAEMQCTPPKAGDPPLPPDAVSALAREVPEWRVEEAAITRELKFKDFRAAIGCVNRIAALAEEQQHHPDIAISYNTVRLTLSTHKIGGLSRNDFILAAKIDRLVDAG